MSRRSGWMLALAAFVVVALCLFALRDAPGPGAMDPSDDSSVESGPASESGASGSELAGRERDAEPAPEIVERRWKLDARLLVEVVRKETQAPIEGIAVRGVIEAHTEVGARHSFEFSRTAVTGRDGVAAFERIPSNATLSVRVEEKGYRHVRDVVIVTSRGSERMRFELVPALDGIEASVLLTLPKGETLPGIGVHFIDRTNRKSGHASPKTALLLDDDPAAPPEHDVELQLILPGYASTPFVRRLRRGTSFELTPPKIARVSQEIAIVDEEGRGVDALAVSVWPTSSQGSSLRFTELEGTTDARGIVTLEGYRGTTWRLEADAARVELPDRSDQRPFVVGDPRPTLRAGLRVPHRIVLDGKDLPDSGRCQLVWRSYEPPPSSAIERLLRDDPSRFRERIRRYVGRLPRTVDWTRAPSGSRIAEIPLLPGDYVVVASTDELFGAETAIRVDRPGGETVVMLERTTPIRVRIEGSFDRTNGPLPYRTMILAHRAGWDERAEIFRVLSDGWAASASRPPPPKGDAFEESFRAHSDQASLALARRMAPSIGRDLAYVGADGACEILAAGAPKGVTVLFPDLRVAYVPIEGDGALFRGRVEPTNFRRIAVRVRRTSGQSFPGYSVRPAPLAHLYAGMQEIGAVPVTDAEGVLRIGILSDESIGLHPGLDEWTVSAGSGASVERLTSGSPGSIVVTTRADVPEPSIDLVAAPHRTR